MSERSLSAQVLHNLNHYNLWTDLSEFKIETNSGTYDICVGRPSKKLHPDDPDGNIVREYVLPVRTNNKWSVKQWGDVFQGVKAAEGLQEVPRRIIMAMVTDDSTVVYYFVNSGLVKPRKN
jgi:tRNA-splicing endonuclease subunit Sen15